MSKRSSYQNWTLHLILQVFSATVSSNSLDNNLGILTSKTFKRYLTLGRDNWQLCYLQFFLESLNWLIHVHSDTESITWPVAIKSPEHRINYRCEGHSRSLQFRVRNMLKWQIPNEISSLMVCTVAWTVIIRNKDCDKNACLRYHASNIRDLK